MILNRQDSVVANQTVDLTPQRNECDKVNDSGQPEEQPAGKEAGGTFTLGGCANSGEDGNDIFHVVQGGGLRSASEGCSGTGVPPVRIVQPTHARDARATTACATFSS